VFELSCGEWDVRLCGKRVCCLLCDEKEECLFIDKELGDTCTLFYDFNNPNECPIFEPDDTIVLIDEITAEIE